jgi:hypothetical protein
MSAAELCTTALESGSNSSREGLLYTVVAAEATCGIISLCILIKSRACFSNTSNSTASDSLNRGLLVRYAHFMSIASFSGAITWFAILQKQNADVSIRAMAGDCLAQMQLHVLSQRWFVVYFVFKPVLLACGMLAKSVPLLRLFDVGNIAHGSKKRDFARATRVIVTFAFVSCNAVSFIASWYGAAVSSSLSHHYASSSQALCSSHSSDA